MEPDFAVFGYRARHRLRLGDADGTELGLDQVEHEIRPEQRDDHQDQEYPLVDPQADQQPALGERAERQDRDQRDREHQHAVADALDADQQQLGVEHEDQRQDRRADVVEEGLDPGAQRVRARYGGGGERGETHRRRRIRHQPEIEHVQVDRDQRQNQARGIAQLDDDAGHQRRNDDVVRGRRQPHAENQADQGGQDEQDIDITARDRLDHPDHGVVEPGRGDRADDDPGDRDRDRDIDHVARAGDQTLIDRDQPVDDGAADPALAAGRRGHRVLGDDDRHQQHDRPEDSAARGPAFDHQQIDQDDDRGQEMDAAEEGPAQMRNIRPRQPSQAELQGLEMRYVEKRHIADRRREGRGNHDVEIADTDKLGDDERRRAHDRRHDLAVGRRRDLDRAGLDRRQPGPAHHRDGEGPGGHDIGDRGAGDHAGHARGQDGGLGRTAAIAPDEGKRQVEEILAGARLVEQRAEQHEQEDEAHRDIDRDAENRLAAHPLIADQPLERDALVRDDLRHRLAEDRIDQEHPRDDHQRDADAAARCLQQEQNTDAADYRLDGEGEFPTEQREIVGQQDPATRDQAVIAEKQIERRAAAEDRQRDIVERQAVGPPQPLGDRKQQETEDQPEGEMHAARGHVDDDADAEHKRQRRGDPELEQRPQRGDAADDGGKRRRHPAAGICQLFERFPDPIRRWLRCVALVPIRHPSSERIGAGPARQRRRAPAPVGIEPDAPATGCYMPFSL